MKTLFFLPFLFISVILNAQNNMVDSLQKVLQAEKEDTNKVKTYTELVKIVRQYDFTEAGKLIEEQILLSKKLHYTWGVGRAQNSLGTIAYAQSKFQEGKTYFHQAVFSFQSIKSYNWLCAVYNNISLLYAAEGMGDSSIYYSHVAEGCNKFVNDSIQNLNNKMSVYASLSSAFYSNNQYDSCVYYNNETIKIAERFNDMMRIADCYATNGQALTANRQYKAAEQNMLKALALYQKTGANNFVYNIKSGLGTIYYSMGKYDESEKFSQQSIQEELEQKDSSILMQNYMNLGLIESGKYNYDDALKYFSEGLAAGENKDDPYSKRQLEQYTGETYLKLEDYNNAIVHSEKAIAWDTADQKIKFECLATISKAYEGLHEYDKALTAFEESKELEKIIFDTIKTKTINDLLIKYGVEKKEQQIKDMATQEQIRALQIVQQKQDISHSKLLTLKQQQEIFIQNLQIEKNTADLKTKELAAKNSYNQLQSERREKQLQALTIANENQRKKFVYSGFMLVAILSGYGFYRYRRHRKMQSEQEMLSERLRISRELHDDIGSTLGSISIYSEVAKNRTARDENAEEALSKIGATSRELIDKMSDIVWSLNPANESFEQLQSRMTAFSAMVLTPGNIPYQFETNEEIKKMQLTNEQRKNIFLIYKEAIYNIAKYAESKKVSILLSVKNKIFTMLIQDDGNGFEIGTSDAYNGNGIINMQARAKEIGAVLNIISNKNAGTSVELIAAL